MPSSTRGNEMLVPTAAPEEIVLAMGGGKVIGQQGLLLACIGRSIVLVEPMDERCGCASPAPL